VIFMVTKSANATQEDGGQGCSTWDKGRRPQIHSTSDADQSRGQLEKVNRHN